MVDTFIEIDPWLDGEDWDDSVPICDITTCGWSCLQDAATLPFGESSRRMFRIVGGDNHGVRLCEQHMEPADIAAAKPLSREPRA